MSVDDLTKTAREVYAAQQSETLHNSVITANLGVYRVIDDAVVFYLLERKGNPLFDEIFHRTAYAHILKREVTRVDGVMKETIVAALDANEAVEVRYSNLRLKWEADNFYYVKNNGENTADEKMLLEGVFGTTNPGDGRRVYLLTEFQVKLELKQHPSDMLISGCILEGTYFFAQGHVAVASYFSGILGVLDANSG